LFLVRRQIDRQGFLVQVGLAQAFFFFLRLIVLFEFTLNEKPEAGEKNNGATTEFRRS
jgi:hypothetical protein